MDNIGLNMKHNKKSGRLLVGGSTAFDLRHSLMCKSYFFDFQFPAAEPKRYVHVFV